MDPNHALTKLEEKPLSPPVAPKDLERMTVVERTAAVLGYSIRRLEFWISPQGRLRQWCRINVAVGLILLIPALTVLPVAVLVFQGVATLTAYLAVIAANLLSVCSSLIGTILLISATILAAQRLKRK